VALPNVVHCGRPDQVDAPLPFHQQIDESLKPRA
jgi:hypothetical protein